jgi:xanthine dehydrogenase YagR molybdenum-binding subunit
MAMKPTIAAAAAPSPLGIKGLGEVGIVGAGAAVANAVYNATGVRVREFPVTVDKLVPHLPATGR